MVQSKGDETKAMVNGDVTKEENGEIKTNENASVDDDESDDDDYLDYLLMVPPTDECSEDRNKSLVSRTLMDLCTAIESRKEYPKIRQELLMQCSRNSVPKQEVEETLAVVVAVVEEEKAVEEEDNLVKIEETIMAEPEAVPADEVMVNGNGDCTKDEPTSTCDEDEEQERLPGGRRQSVRLKKAQFVPSDNEPTINDQFFVCRRCTIFFKTKELRKLHNLAHHRKKDVTMTTKTEEALEPPTAKLDEIATATPSAEKTAEKPSQKARLRRPSTLDPFICDLCPKVFKQKPLLRSHMNCHVSEPQFFCKQCSYASKRNADVKKHYETHHDPDSGKFLKRKRKCEHCSEILNGKKAFLQHMRASHAEALKKIRTGITKKCEQCPEVFNSIKMFRIHMKKSHQAPVKDIRCEKCNRKFKTNFRLRKHVAKYVALGTECKVQTPAKPPPPPAAAAPLVTAAVPISKQNGHSPENKKTPFTCEHCEKKFTLKSHLSLHMKKHQSLTCNKCNTVFKSKFNLKWHEFSHLEIEPKCPQCLRSFTSESSYAVHLKKNNCMTNGNH